MNYFVLLIFFATSCGAMEYSRVECLPPDIKLKLIKNIIRQSSSAEQAINAIKTFISADRLFHKNNAHRAHLNTFEDYLGWDWNKEQPLPLAKRENPDAEFFTTDISFFRLRILDRELLAFKERFKEFKKKVQTKEPISEELLYQLDLRHTYEYNDTEVVEIGHGAPSVSMTFNRNWTPLYLAVHYQNSHAVRQLLSHGCDTEKQSCSELTPLQLASSMGHQHMVKIFIDHKVLLNAKSPNGKTAMHLAAKNGHMDVMNMLLRAGADHTIKDSKGHIAADYIKNRIPIG